MHCAPTSFCVLSDPVRWHSLGQNVRVNDHEWRRPTGTCNVRVKDPSVLSYVGLPVTTRRLHPLLYSARRRKRSSPA